MNAMSAYSVGFAISTIIYHLVVNTSLRCLFQYSYPSKQLFCIWFHIWQITFADYIDVYIYIYIAFKWVVSSFSVVFRLPN